MKKPLIATALLIAFAAPAFAAPAQNAQQRPPQHFVVEDTAQKCSVIDSRPSKELRIIGNKQGYPSHEAALQALKGMAPCKTQG